MMYDEKPTSTVVERPDGLPRLVGSLDERGWVAPRQKDLSTPSGVPRGASSRRRITRRWAIGDWLNFGERKHGETYVQAADELGYNPQFLRVCKMVAAKFPRSQRHPTLLFSHHRVVSSLPSRSWRSPC